MTIQKESYYFILADNGKALEACRDEHGNILLQLYPREDRSAQHWRFDHAGDSSYRIYNKEYNRVVDLMYGGTEDGTRVHLWEIASTPTQRWNLLRSEDNLYKILSRHAGKTIDLVDAYTGDGAVAQIWEDLDAKNQFWQIIPVDMADTILSEVEKQEIQDETNNSHEKFGALDALHAAESREENKPNPTLKTSVHVIEQEMSSKPSIKKPGIKEPEETKAINNALKENEASKTEDKTTDSSLNLSKKPERTVKTKTQQKAKTSVSKKSSKPKITTKSPKNTQPKRSVVHEAPSKEETQKTKAVDAVKLESVDAPKSKGASSNSTIREALKKVSKAPTKTKK